MNQSNYRHDFHKKWMVSPDDKPTKSYLIGRILLIGDDLRSGEKVPGSEHQSQEAKALEHL